MYVMLDADGHTFSPALRAQEKEVAELHARLPVLAAEGVAVFDRLYAEGFACTTPEEARERFVAAYVLARELNHRRGEADALNMAAITYRELGDVRGAAELFEGSRALLARLGDAPGEAAALGSIGVARAALGELDAAQSAHEEGLAIARRLRDGRSPAGRAHAARCAAAARGRCGRRTPRSARPSRAPPRPATPSPKRACCSGSGDICGAGWAGCGGGGAPRARACALPSSRRRRVAPPDPAAAEAAGADGARRRSAPAAGGGTAPRQRSRRCGCRYCGRRVRSLCRWASDEARRCEATIDEARRLGGARKEGARERAMQ